jgi:DNA-binding protein HU-beta
MTKLELVNQIAQKNGFKKAHIQRILEDALDLIKEDVSNGKTIHLIGFGSFDALDVKDKKARNIQTGEQIVIPAHKVPRFKPSPTFKDMVKK